MSIFFVIILFNLFMYLKIYKERVNILLENFVNKIEDNDLKQMVEYSLFGGKRLRSIICLYLLDKFSLKNDNIVIGIEFLHCASLILDDLPCMDNDEFRRGMQTFHKRYGRKNAYIVANYLFTEFNKFVVNINDNKLLTYIFKNLILIVKGQYCDLGLEIKINNEKKEDIIYKNNLKTYPFFVLAFIIPFYLKGNYDYRKDIETIAYKFSIAFQIYDDFFDFEQDKINNTFNHIKLLGKVETYNLYKTNIVDFNSLCKKYDINSDLFNEIIKYLNDNLEEYVNGL